MVILIVTIGKITTYRIDTQNVKRNDNLVEWDRTLIILKKNYF